MITTSEQLASLSRIRELWSWVGEPTAMIGGDGAIVVPVGSVAGEPFMWLAIEPDGHAHS